MRFKILSDSTCDLPKELLDRYDITLVPLTVVKDGTDLKDGLDITPADIFAHVAAGGSLCSTSAVSVGEYEEFFEKYAAAYDGVVLVNLGSGFSSSHQNALIAAEDYPNVRCIDSKALSAGQGLIALKAAQLADRYEDLDALAEAVRAYIPKLEGNFVLDQLKFLVKGGRCSSLAALGANMLNLKPCIALNEGRLTVAKKYRGSYTRCLTSYVKERLEGREDLDTDTLFLIYTVDQPKDVLDAVRETIFQYGNFTHVIESYAGCTVSCHCGPGTLGLMYLKK